MSVFEVKICWGHFDYLGFWYPNKNISVSPDDQYKENVKNGYL